jgi:metal-responsive CopG/Arc/MetJ family transcriptional regulator
MSKRRITMDLDERLLTAVDTAAAQRRKSRNQLITDAVERMVREIERERVDAAFARMAEDAAYQAELQQIDQEMSPASDAAWRLIDRTERVSEGSG